MPIRKRKIQRSVIIKQVGQISHLIAAQISVSHLSKTRDLRSAARRSCNIILKSISMLTKTGRKKIAQKCAYIHKTSLYFAIIYVVDKHRNNFIDIN